MAERAKIGDVVNGGDLRRSLEAIRDDLAATIDEGALCRECGTEVAAAKGPLVRQLRDVLRQLHDLGPAGKVVTPLDQAREARARRKGAAVPKRAAGADKRRAGSDRAGGKRGAATGPVAAGRPRRSAGRKS